MSAIASWMTAKHLALMVLSAGLLGNLVLRCPARRQRAVYGLLTPGLLATWWVSYGLLRAHDLDLSTPWVSGGFASSFAAFVAAVWSVEKPGRRWAAGLSVLFHLATLGLMVYRPGSLP